MGEVRAVILEEQGATPRLVHDWPVPEPEASQVRIAVRGSSLNPVDILVAHGGMQGLLTYQFPAVLGRDLAGVVDAVGPEATRYDVGDPVYGFLRTPVVHEGTWADFVVVPEGEFISPAPRTLELADAAVYPQAGCAALVALETLELAPGCRLLVVGGTGGVGGFVIRLAASRGCHVIASGLAEDEEYLRELGAAEVVGRADTAAGDVLRRHPGGIERLLDLVSTKPRNLATYATVLAVGGIAVSGAGAATTAPLREGATGRNFATPADTARLAELTRLIDAGMLRARVERVYPLEEIHRALTDYGREHKRGKIAISLAPIPAGP